MRGWGRRQGGNGLVDVSDRDGTVARRRISHDRTRRAGQGWRQRDGHDLVRNDRARRVGSQWSGHGNDSTIGPHPGDTIPPSASDVPSTTAPQIPSSGPPPWSAASLNLGDLSDVYRLEWAEAGEPTACPFLAFADLGPQAAQAVIRRAENHGEMLVVWDNPDGPGHGRSSEPCDDCGRGVVGIGTFQGDYHATGPATIAWDDGSFVNIAVLPWAYGISARLKPAGSNCIYQLWSHISREHVEFLISQLRLVET